MELPAHLASLLLPTGRPTPHFRDPDDVLVGQIVQSWEEATAADLALVGVPFDTSVLGRRGARFGPAGIRQVLLSSAACAPGLGVDLAAGPRFVDFGDVDVVHTDVAETHRRVETVVAGICRLGATPVVLGGDHGTSYATILGLANAGGGPVGVVQIDAHLDVRALHRGEISSGTPFRRLLEAPGDVLRGSNLVQLGIGDWRNSRRYLDYSSAQGTLVIPARAVHQRGPEAVVGDALTRATDGTRGFFVSFDLDALDPAYAPGVSAHAPGGLTAVEALEIVFQLGQHPLCRGFDLVELAPPLDVQDLSSHLAAALTLHFLAASAIRLERRGQQQTRNTEGKKCNPSPQTGRPRSQ
jgi:agmatinase